MTFFAFWNSEAEPKSGSPVICMYLLVGWAICVAVDQFLSPRVILWWSKLRSTRWGLESYSSHPLGIQEQSGWVHSWVSSHSYIYGRLLVCLGHYFSVPYFQYDSGPHIVYLSFLLRCSMPGHKNWSTAMKIAQRNWKYIPRTDDPTAKPAWLFQNTKRKWVVRFWSPGYISHHCAAN